MGFVVSLYRIHLLWKLGLFFFFFKANGLFPSFGFKEPREWHFFLFLTDSSWLMRGAMHHQRYLILWIYIIYAKSNTGTDAFSEELLLLQEKPPSLPNTEAKSDKPSHTLIHLLSFVPRFAACLGANDTECRSVPLVTQVFFALTAYKSLKETPAWERQRSLCCSDNWKRTPGSVCHCHANGAQPAVNRARPLTRSCREKHMWHRRCTCDAHVILRGDKHVLTGFTSHTHTLDTHTHTLLFTYWW